ncbi:MAG: hypothetical protein PF549_02135 [Patescibacteria group bacterium]|nr:hypothetical protein [Patescibacteria group bacterium]
MLFGGSKKRVSGGDRELISLVFRENFELIDGGRFEVSDDKKVGVGESVFLKDFPVVIFRERVVLEFLINLRVFFSAFSIS